ncbi:hypothetical protein ASPTUDRAFT_895658 [Aspergillus tubingensis CBS 134.48]|uniref:Uncharacterized protein n=1 Tax=Aspergillus tubingensis (strain CBS 134.48) TaxID=767770 RepID=A0A1L9MRS0_ASPTC|nr:hypothetical protein ASPTUDRAFT_895658 [Aspergillus tubingensis CBS 134.48]
MRVLCAGMGDMVGWFKGRIVVVSSTFVILFLMSLFMFDDLNRRVHFWVYWCQLGVVSSTDKRPIIALVPPLLSFSLAPSVRIDGGMQSRMWEVQELSSNFMYGRPDVPTPPADE